MTSERNADNKNDVSDSLSCFQCKKTLNPFNYLSLRKYEEIDDNERLKVSYDLCSTECLNKILESEVSYDNGFEFCEISRCVGYYDCKRMDNLRRICESRELKSLSNHSIYGLVTARRAPACSPAEVGIIKSNIKLLDLIDKFDKSSTQISKETLEHTKDMKNLTWVILIATLLNLFFFFYQIFGNVILGAVIGAK